MSSEGEGRAELSITLLNGIVDPVRYGSKVYVEIRLRDQVRRFPPVDVDPSTGDVSYEHADAAKIRSFDLNDIWRDLVYVVLRTWDPASDWTDAAQIMVPVQSIGIREECEFRTFLLEPLGEKQMEDEEKPRLVLRATLTSCFRPSVETVARLLEGYTTTVDRTLDIVSAQSDRVVPYLSSRYALVPAIPMGVFVLASLPLVVVLGIAGLPLIVPIALMMTAVVGMLALAGGAVWAGSRKGRARIQEIAKPVIEKVNDDPEVLYPIGPTPTPTRVVRSLTPTSMWPKLVLSIIVDFIGCTSYAVPVLGEVTDLLWAPIAFVLIDAMYHDSSPWAGWIGAVEELLPFTDLIPTATLAWLKQYGPLIFCTLRQMFAAGRVDLGVSHNSGVDVTVVSEGS